MSADGSRPPSRRVTFVADELLGYAGNGLGTTTTFLAVALARLGHRIEVLFLGKPPRDPIDPEWARLYEKFEVAVIPLGPGADRVEPKYFQRPWDVARTLRSDP